MSEQNNKDVRGGEGGFSMIEMMIAIGVITVGLVAVVGISIYVSRANTASNHLNVVAAVAQDQVDRLRTAVWTRRNDNDPRLAVGGTLPTEGGTPPAPVEDAAATATASASPEGGTVPTYPAPGGGDATPIYQYTLDPNDPHHATVTNTPAGNMDIYWQVRQGSTPDIRYVTIRVVPRRGNDYLRRGMTVSTVIVRG